MTYFDLSVKHGGEHLRKAVSPRWAEHTEVCVLLRNPENGRSEGWRVCGSERPGHREGPRDRDTEAKRHTETERPRTPLSARVKPEALSSACLTGCPLTVSDPENPACPRITPAERPPTEALAQHACPLLLWLAGRGFRHRAHAGCLES